MFEGQEVEGYDPDKYYRIWQRIESAEVLYDDFYSGSTESILREADFLERELVGAKRSHKSIKYSIPIYDELYRKQIKRVTSSNVNKISANIFRKINNQGSRFVIDLSMSGIKRESAILKTAEILEDDRLNEVMLVINGKLIKINK